MNHIKELREQRGIQQKELAIDLGVSQPTVSDWESGRKYPSAKSTMKLSKYFKVSVEYLMGENTPAAPNIIDENETSKYIHVPIMGSIPAGIPFEAIENIVDYEDIPANASTHGKQYFGLKIKGNSMEPEYRDGDTVIFERVSQCENGDDCAVMVNGNDATFKRVKLNEKGITLMPLNPSYDPIPFTNKEIEDLPVRVIGVVVEIRRRLRKRIGGNPYERKTSVK